MNWYTNLWQRLVDKLLDYWLEAVVIGLVTASGFFIKEWLFVPIEIWPIVLVVIAVIFVVMANRLYVLSPKTFVPFPVRDIDLDVAWWIKDDPTNWIEVIFDHAPNTYTDSLLDGPLCRNRKENGDLCLGEFRRLDGPELYEECCVCHRALYKNDDGTTASVKISKSQLKLTVIKALQREAKRGKRMKKNFTFGMIDLKK